MAKYKMVTLTNPVEGREEAYNDWYQNVHLPEVVAYKGVTKDSSRRGVSARTSSS